MVLIGHLGGYSVYRIRRAGASHKSGCFPQGPAKHGHRTPASRAPAAPLGTIGGLNTRNTPADGFDYESALEACARGERFALRALYDREARFLLGVAQRIVGDRESAEDVLQEAFLLVWQRARTFQRQLGSGRGWIYTVLRHRALDEVRRRRPERPMGDAFDALAAAHDLQSSAADDLAQGHSRADAIERCMQELDERGRACIAYAFIEGYTHQQIAARLQAPVGSVKSWIRRGLLALKACLS